MATNQNDEPVFTNPHSNQYMGPDGKPVIISGPGITNAPDDLFTAQQQWQAMHPGNQEPVMGWHTEPGDNGKPVRVWSGYAGEEPSVDPESPEGKAAMQARINAITAAMEGSQPSLPTDSPIMSTAHNTDVVPGGTTTVITATVPFESGVVYGANGERMVIKGDLPELLPTKGLSVHDKMQALFDEVDKSLGGSGHKDPKVNQPVEIIEGKGNVDRGPFGLNGGLVKPGEAPAKMEDGLVRVGETPAEVKLMNEQQSPGAKSCLENLSAGALQQLAQMDLSKISASMENFNHNQMDSCAVPNSKPAGKSQNTPS